MKNKIEDLRNHLFATLEDLRDKEKPTDLDSAKKVAEVAQVIIETAKVEVEFIKVTGASSGTGFIPQTTPVPSLGTAAQPRLVKGV